MIRWTPNDVDYHSGVSESTDMVYELKRGQSDNPLWWVSEMAAGEHPRSLTGLAGLDVAKAYCMARDRNRQTGEVW
jgi:hypothetical protein